MRSPLPLALVALLHSIVPDVHASSSSLVHPAKRDYDLYDYFVLEHDPATLVPLREVLDTLDLEFVQQAGQLRDHWLLRRLRLADGQAKRDGGLDALDALVRKRSLDTQSFSPEVLRASRAVRHLAPQVPRMRIKRDDTLLMERQPEPWDHDWLNMTSKEIAEREEITDPLFGEQWHLVNDANPVHMVNVAPVWDMGITGEGVISAMVDDGLDYESDDLAPNFDGEDSYDFNLHVPLPKPMLFDDHHGTRCAGQIAAVKNDVCGVGIAFNSKVAGIRILSGPISDADEAAALNYGFQHTSIYSCSWGPSDDGRSMEGPSFLIQKAVVNGIQNGRGGKGSIFVFASGNGAAQGDQCNFDGYTNSIYSVTVSAVDHKGLRPYYSEPCAANMVVSYSSGSGKHIVTTDVGKDKCSYSHGGTSAAAPNAVGIFALALSARPDLTWRDIQHLCVRTAKAINPDDPDWEDTAVGRRFSYKYGYGNLDAYEFVKAAQNWTLVKPQAWLQTIPVQIENGTMTLDGQMSGGAPIVPGGVASKTTITADMLKETNLETLEHVTIKVWIQHTRRGDVEVELVSPKGVKSVLAASRQFDADKSGFPGWIFMTVKHWEENPVGEWTIRVSDQAKADENGSFLGWQMTLWGSTIDPAQAKTFVLSDPNTPFPPPVDQYDTPSPKPSATRSKLLPKPTQHLPGDHGTAEGEADKPAFSSATPTGTASAPIESDIENEAMTPTPDEGWFPGMYNLVTSSKWFFGAIGGVVLFGIAGGVFFLWRRRAARRAHSQYRSIAGDEMNMSALDGRRGGRGAAARGTKELYDAFGEVSDDEDDVYADEETGLRQPLAQHRELGFNSDFLDDDERPPQPLYSDEPTQRDLLREVGEGRSPDGSKSPSSADGSWEHADPS